MPRKSKRAELILTTKQREQLNNISQSRTAPLREVERAKILLKYVDGVSISKIQAELNISRPTIYKCIDKALTMGSETGLKDKYHSPKARVITDAAKAWVVSLACTKPKELGYAAETWSHRLLAQHTRQYAPRAGHYCLKNAAKATIQRILKEYPTQPHKVRYYTENRDPEFNQKMHDVLVVYQQVNVQNEQLTSAQELPVITVSIDEKPGIQAINNVAADLPPLPGKRPLCWPRLSL